MAGAHGVPSTVLGADSQRVYPAQRMLDLHVVTRKEVKLTETLVPECLT